MLKSLKFDIPFSILKIIKEGYKVQCNRHCYHNTNLHPATCYLETLYQDLRTPEGVLHPCTLHPVILKFPRSAQYNPANHLHKNAIREPTSSDVLCGFPACP